MPALEVIAGYVTAPDTTLTDWTMNAGDSLRIRDFPNSSKAFLFSYNCLNQADGDLRIRGPKMHDNVRGIQMRIETTYGVNYVPPNAYQLLYPSEYLIAEQSGSAGQDDIEQGAFHVYYDDLPGGCARLATPDEVFARAKNIFRVRQEITAGTSGSYSGEQAINADIDLFKADVDYALLGAISNEDVNIIGVRGIDTANLRVGIPGGQICSYICSDWFVRVSKALQRPAIPLINGSNKDATFCDVTNDESALSPKIDLIFAELE